MLKTANIILNRKNIPWNPHIRTMKQNCIIFSNQLIHIWHGVIQNVSMVLNTHGMGEWGGSINELIKLSK